MTASLKQRFRQPGPCDSNDPIRGAYIRLHCDSLNQMIKKDFMTMTRIFYKEDGVVNIGKV